MCLYMSRLLEDLCNLGMGYSISIQDDYRRLLIHDFVLPPGFNHYSCEVLVEIPSDYPCTPPGLSSNKIFLPADLRFKGHRLQDFREYQVSDMDNWAWFCFEEIAWDSTRDDLISLMEMVRTRLTIPPTH